MSLQRSSIVGVLIGLGFAAGCARMLLALCLPWGAAGWAHAAPLYIDPEVSRLLSQGQNAAIIVEFDDTMPAARRSAIVTISVMGSRGDSFDREASTSSRMRSSRCR